MYAYPHYDITAEVQVRPHGVIGVLEAVCKYRPWFFTCPLLPQLSFIEFLISDSLVQHGCKANVNGEVAVSGVRFASYGEERETSVPSAVRVRPFGVSA